jgi:hypothetical protein
MIRHQPTDESVGLPFQLHAEPSAGRTTIGWMMAALLRMFLAALRSAFSLCPQLTQRKSDRVGWLSLLGSNFTLTVSNIET